MIRLDGRWENTEEIEPQRHRDTEKRRRGEEE
jgi:hypothetical protein